MTVDPKRYEAAIERIFATMAARGMTHHALSIAAGMSRGYLYDRQRGIREPKYRYWPKDETFRGLAKALQVSVDYLKMESDDPSIGTTPSPGSAPTHLQDATIPYRPSPRSNLMLAPGMASRPSDRSVPIKRIAGRGARGGYLMADDIIDFAARTAPIQAAQDVWAFVPIDNTMAPAYEIDTPAYVDPNRPPIEMNYAIFLLAPDGTEPFGTCEWLFRLFVRETQTHYIVRQLTPEVETRIAKKDVVRVLRVLKHKEVLR